MCFYLYLLVFLWALFCMSMCHVDWLPVCQSRFLDIFLGKGNEVCIFYKNEKLSDNTDQERSQVGFRGYPLLLHDDRRNINLKMEIPLKIQEFQLRSEQAVKELLTRSFVFDHE